MFVFGFFVFGGKMKLLKSYWGISEVVDLVWVWCFLCYGYVCERFICKKYNIFGRFLC